MPVACRSPTAASSHGGHGGHRATGPRASGTDSGSCPSSHLTRSSPSHPRGPRVLSRVTTKGRPREAHSGALGTLGRDRGPRPVCPRALGGLLRGGDQRARVHGRRVPTLGPLPRAPAQGLSGGNALRGRLRHRATRPAGSPARAPRPRNACSRRQRELVLLWVSGARGSAPPGLGGVYTPEHACHPPGHRFQNSWCHGLSRPCRGPSTETMNVSLPLQRFHGKTRPPGRRRPALLPPGGLPGPWGTGGRSAPTAIVPVLPAAQSSSPC